MKLSIIFGCVLLAAVFQQGESSSELDSTIRKAFVVVLETINGIFSATANDANDYLTEKLENYTQIKEWSATIQTNVLAGITKVVFDIYNAFKVIVLATDPSDLETLVLTCVADQEPALLVAVKSAASQNGWCNNRLAPNLTLAFQEVSKNLVDFTASLETYLETLSSCLFTDDICYAAFAVEVTALVTAEIGTSGSLWDALDDVASIYKIMFGEDVPSCYNEYLKPIILEGVETALANLTTCVL